MLDTKEIEIGGDAYRIGRLPADRALDVALRVLESRGTVLAALHDVDLGDTITDPMRQLAALGRAQAAMARAMRDPDFQPHVLRPLLSACMRGGVPVLGADWLVYYAGRLGDLLAVYAAAVDWNCASFFEGFGATHPVIAAFKRDGATSPEPSTPPATPTPSPSAP